MQGLPHPQKGLALREALGLWDVPAECFCSPGTAPGSLCDRVVDGGTCGCVEGLQAQGSHVGS